MTWWQLLLFAYMIPGAIMVMFGVVVLLYTSLFPDPDTSKNTKGKTVALSMILLCCLWPLTLVVLIKQAR